MPKRDSGSGGSYADSGRDAADQDTATITCPNPRFADCDNDPENGCETIIVGDGSNCGGCGITCAPEQACWTTCCDPYHLDCDGDPSTGCEVEGTRCP